MCCAGWLGCIAAYSGSAEAERAAEAECQAGLWQDLLICFKSQIPSQKLLNLPIKPQTSLSLQFIASST